MLNNRLGTFFRSQQPMKRFVFGPPWSVCLPIGGTWARPLDSCYRIPYYPGAKFGRLGFPRLYHLESRWLNSHLSVYHGPLLSHLLKVAPSAFTTLLLKEYCGSSWWFRNPFKILKLPVKRGRFMTAGIGIIFLRMGKWNRNTYAFWGWLDTPSHHSLTIWLDEKFSPETVPSRLRFGLPTLSMWWTSG